jgi:hypothetical protein
MRNALHSAPKVFRIIAAGLLFLLSPMARAEHNPGPCSNKSLKGTFGFYRTGTIDQGAGGLAALGILSFDGYGNATVNQSISRNGDYSFDVSGSFTYQVDADCTGKGFLDGNEFVRIVVTDSGRGIYMFSESDGNAVHGVGTKINTD